MFVILDDYVKPLPEVDRVYPAHKLWLEQHRKSGRFLGFGRRVPPTGGVIIARGSNREEIYSIIASDPFFKEGISEYEVVEFNPSSRSPELEH